MFWGWKGLKETAHICMCMSSVNVSVNDRAYAAYKRRLQRNGESFSQSLLRLADAKDITRCFGLLKDTDDDTWKSVFEEMERVRKHPMRGVVR